jgi:hypothetical protein
MTQPANPPLTTTTNNTSATDEQQPPAESDRGMKKGNKFNLILYSCGLNDIWMN